MPNQFEFRLTIEVNQKQIELQATFDENRELMSAELTDAARDYLMNQDLGSLFGAVTEAMGALGLQQGEVDQTFAAIKEQILEIPGAAEVVKLMEAPIYLTDLEFRPDRELVIGVLIEYTLNVKILTVSRLGVKATIDLTTSEAE